MKQNSLKKVSAQWPSDYTGTQKAWVGVLRKMGLWNGRGYFGDKLITLDEWNVVLAEAERVSRET